MSAGIAIVGMACCYPDARSPRELWENVLARRRAFRRLPPGRLSLGDYLSSDPATADAIYSAEAALIEGYEFDRVRFRVAGPIFRSVDLAHWLALDVADQALQDAGFADGSGLPRETTGVLVGNTLTGEFSRAATLRLRWPYVRRLVEARLLTEGWEDKHRLSFLDELEQDYKAPFAPVGEETLAGALSNTIAGRICNYFHFGGGGYTLDGACCSSLLAVARACSALEAGEIDAALAGGVDLSIDPFELVGFAKAGALARGEMRVYDRESTGFLPGEGSGFVALMRAEDAIAQRLRSYAVIRGWGISSDGGGSITRPEVRGQALALQRAYQRASYGAETVALFEGHGTGTPVGDQVELHTLMAARSAAGTSTLPAAIGSIKANIGHTKAAAGVAGLIKAAMAVYHQALPPTTGVRQPRPELETEGAVLRVLEDAEPWPGNFPVRAGINSFGFGGINVHVTIEGCQPERAAGFSLREQMLLSSTQDAELFLLDGDDPAALAQQAGVLAGDAPGFSYSDLSDVAGALAQRLSSRPCRAAVVARTPAELADRLNAVRDLLKRDLRRQKQGSAHHLDPDGGLFVGAAASPPRIGFLFPGQASPVRLNAGIHGRRFTEIRELYQAACLSKNADAGSTHVAQLAIAVSELAGLRLLRALGIEATVGIGHSLGELAAYCWAGALDESSLLRLVDTRGRLMTDLPGPAGAMANIGASSAEIDGLIGESEPVVLACFNSPQQTVVAGESHAVARVVARAQATGWSATVLPAAHAFHSPLMSPAATPFQETVDALALTALQRRVVSTITGAELSPTAGLRRLLVAQLTAPVRFTEAFNQVSQSCDLLIEVGPGQVLTHLVNGHVPAIALDIAGPSLAGVLSAAAAAYVMGAPLRLETLFSSRFTRPFNLDRPLRFFVNPCELAPASTTISRGPRAIQAGQNGNAAAKTATEQRSPASASVGSAVQVIRALVARRTELPPAAVQESARLLGDLHLNSIVVAEMVAAAARELGMAPPVRPLDFADATVGELAQALERLRKTSPGLVPEHEAAPAGVDDWIRAFFVEWAPSSLPPRSGSPSLPGRWSVFASASHPLEEHLSKTVFPGSGVIVCLSSDRMEQQAGVLLQAAHAALASSEGKGYFVVAGPQASLSSAFARTLHLENPGILTRVIEAASDSVLGDYIFRELAHASGHIEARYDGAGQRWAPGLKILPGGSEDHIPLQPDDVLLVSGGGKGIVAECASAIARETGARLVVLGRSRPEDSAELTQQLARLAAGGVTVKYIPTDITDAQAVRSAVREAESGFGRVAAIVHGAGLNEPALLRDLDEPALQRTLAPKVGGLQNLLAAVDAAQLRLLVTFGSVIGRVGLRGEAHYALANACLTFLTEEFARRHPACRCLAFESSAWSGLGMAQRLGTVEALHRDGIATIPPKEGVAWFRNLLARRLPETAVVVTGRLAAASPLPIHAPPIPLMRFLERPRVHYPGVELVVESDVTTASDPYLLDHVFAGQPLLPGVMGLEAMAQAAMAVACEERIPVLEHVRFEQPVVVEPRTRVTLRIAALVRETGLVEVVLRSSQTAFAMDHFRCVCRFTDSHVPSGDIPPLPEFPRLAVEPERDLYGVLLFQTGRFRRLAGYRWLTARSSWAEIAPVDRQARSSQNWFSQYLPGALMLGDPAARDAAVHSVQACVPHAVLLPVGVERLTAGRLNAEEKLLAHARERWQQGNTYCYDVELRSADGTLRELWEGLTLRKVADASAHAWPDPLVAASLEWRMREMTTSTELAAAFERDPATDRRSRSERAIQRALGSRQAVRWRSDGKPEVESAMSVSSAHMNGLTLAVAAPELVACDLEPICHRPDQVWRDLLGPERWALAELISRQTGEDLQTSATRVWTALESLKKAGSLLDGQLVLVPGPLEKQGCVSLAAAGLGISSTIVTFRDDPIPVAVSILTQGAGNA